MVSETATNSASSDNVPPAARSGITPARQTHGRWPADAAACAVVLTVLLGIVESLFAAWFARHADIPLRLRAAALGATLATHLICWLPLMAVGAIVVGPLVREGRAAQRFGPVEAILAGLFVLVAGSVVLAGDWMIGQRFQGRRLAICVGVSALGALVAWLALRLIMRSESGARRMRSLLRGAAVICAIIAVAAIAGMAGTPMAGAARYRVRVSVASAPTTRPERPNIALIVLDTVRADRMSVYGYGRETTPRLAAMAHAATVFDRAVANSIWTVPSHATMFTGLAARQHGANHGFVHLDDRFETIAEGLRAAGYDTVCLSNNAFVSSTFNLTQGFAHDPAMYEMRRLTKTFAESWLEWLGLPPPLPWMEVDLGAALTNYTLGRWLERRRDARRPFFALVNYMEAHLPYRVPREFRRSFMNAEQVTRSYALRRQAYGNILELLNVRYNFLDPNCIAASDQKVLAAQYDACLNYLDMRVGEVMDLLEAAGAGTNTVVIVTSDHGEALGEHGLWAHERGIYDTLIRVPLLIRDGRAPRGVRVSRPVQLADLFPTVLNLGGVEQAPIPGCTARDLLGEEEKERIVIAEQVITDENRLRWAARNNPLFDAVRDAPALHAVVGPRFKLIHSSTGRHELYDTLRDPAETYNLVAQQPQVAREMEEELQAWLETVPSHERGARPAELSREMIENLRSVGYVQ